jgi:hypothetical protein
MMHQNQQQTNTQTNAPPETFAVAPSLPDATASQEVSQETSDVENQTALAMDASQRLIALLRREQKKQRTFWIVWFSAMLGYGFGERYVFEWLLQQGLSVLMAFALTGSFLYLIVLSGAISFSFYERRSRKRLSLPDWDDVSLVGPLIEAYTNQSFSPFNILERRTILNALTRLLPRMTIQEARLLTEPQRRGLRSILMNGGYINFSWFIREKYHDPELMAAAIQTFTKIGDPRCLSEVQELAQHAKQERVQAMARECLPALEALREQEQGSETLLRATNAPTDSLLRPAQAGPVEEPQQLLRASKRDDQM